ALQLPQALVDLQLIVDQDLDVLVEHFLFLIRQRLEADKRVLQLLFGERVAQLLHAIAEGVAAGVLAQHQRRLGQADADWVHDLVRLAMLEDAVLVDARLVGEGVLADDGLVALDHDAGQRRDHAARRVQLGRVDARADAVIVAAGPQDHDDLFQRGVSGALADAVDGALDLARTALDGSHRGGYRHAQVVVAMSRQDDALVADDRQTGDQVRDDRAVGPGPDLPDRRG